MDIIINTDLDVAPENTNIIPTHGNFYHNLLSCLGYSNESPPVADLLRRYHHLEGEWMVASPIHWQATHNDAMIIASGNSLELSDEESRRWFGAFEEFIAPENMSLYYHDAHTWLLQTKSSKPEITAKPVHTLYHQSMMPELKLLDKTFFWQRFFTENQMFFSAHPLNNERTGLYPINGVWIWGRGTLDVNVSTPLACQDKELLELANVLSTNVSDNQDSNQAPKNAMFLYKTLDQNARHSLQKQLQKNTVRWYWNNQAYQSKPKSWISRLMEKI